VRTDGRGDLNRLSAVFRARPKVKATATVGGSEMSILRILIGIKETSMVNCSK
jgi:hypothetical protein